MANTDLGFTPPTTTLLLSIIIMLNSNGIAKHIFNDDKRNPTQLFHSHPLHPPSCCCFSRKRSLPSLFARKKPKHTILTREAHHTDTKMHAHKYAHITTTHTHTPIFFHFKIEVIFKSSINDLKIRHLKRFSQIGILKTDQHYTGTWLPKEGRLLIIVCC